MRNDSQIRAGPKKKKTLNSSSVAPGNANRLQKYLECFNLLILISIVDICNALITHTNTFAYLRYTFLYKHSHLSMPSFKNTNKFLEQSKFHLKNKNTYVSLLI